MKHRALEQAARLLPFRQDMRARPFAFAVLASFLASACRIRSGDGQTTDWATDDLSASFVVASDGGSRVRIRAGLYAYAGSKGLPLGDGDRLDVTFGGAPVALERDGEDYVGEMPAPMTPAALAVAFVRGNGRTSAPSSSVTLSKPFSIHDAPSSWSASGDLSLRATGLEGGEVEVVASGSCVVAGVDRTTVSAAANGDVNVPPSRIHFVEAPDCALTVDVRVVSVGIVDPAFRRPDPQTEAQGAIAIQQRRFEVTVTP